MNSIWLFSKPCVQHCNAAKCLCGCFSNLGSGLLCDAHRRGFECIMRLMPPQSGTGCRHRILGGERILRLVWAQPGDAELDLHTC
mmetsp:Transcript_94995/g.247857  ORF Transcript_94995/g.247857 Transcript_94995/m.247857 type:complete len:85 (+) Transcript_94995:22-276(+)